MQSESPGKTDHFLLTSILKCLMLKGMKKRWSHTIFEQRLPQFCPVDEGLISVLLNMENKLSMVFHIFGCLKIKKKNNQTSQLIICEKVARGTSSRYLSCECVIPADHYCFSLCACSAHLKNCVWFCCNSILFALVLFFLANKQEQSSPTHCRSSWIL